MTAATAVPFVEDAIRKNGFRLIHRGPIFVRDPKNALVDLPAPHLSLIDGDMAYL